MRKEVSNKLQNAAKKLYDNMEYISDFIYKNPEIGGKEKIASAFLTEIAKNKGFSITHKYCNLDTAFLAEYKNGEGPVIGIVVEYDALPNFGPNGSPGHACGHNWVAAVGMGAGFILMEMKDFFSGTIRIIGTPAMENLGCKADMIKAHAFDDVDVVMQSHLEHYTSAKCKFLALDALEFSFKGRASHAAASPEEGINALDAVQFTFMGINAIRPYLRADAKIHGIIPEGGTAPSVIPGNASCKFYVRAEERKYLDSIKKKIIRCAEGAAMMAGAEMTMSYFENPYDNMINLDVLRHTALKYMLEEDIHEVEDYDGIAEFTSSDIGNVSHVCPTLYMEFDVEADGEFRVHENSAMNYVNSRFSTSKLHQVSKIMAKIAIEIFNDEKLLNDIKREHRQMMKEYVIG